MTDKQRSASMNQKINRSSLGTQSAKQVRSRTPAAVSETIVDRSTQLSTQKYK